MGAGALGVPVPPCLASRQRCMHGRAVQGSALSLGDKITLNQTKEVNTSADADAGAEGGA